MSYLEACRTCSFPNALNFTALFCGIGRSAVVDVQRILCGGVMLEMIITFDTLEAHLNMPHTVVFVRHGQSKWNLENKFTG